MIHGESRFFINWQMPKSLSKDLMNSSTDYEQQKELLRNWLEHTGIYKRMKITVTSEIKEVISQFTFNNFNFCQSKTFPEQKATIVVELMHYLMRQIVDFGEALTEDQSYENFKSLLLRHAVHRPPHSLSILTLEDVKAIDIYA